MQIREMDLKELFEIYKVLKQLRVGLSYKEFEDLVYDMQHMEYKMFGVLERGELISFAGVAVMTNFEFKRHLSVFDFVTDKAFRSQGYAKLMLEFLEDYAKMAMCEKILFFGDFLDKENQKFYEKNGFKKRETFFIKSIKHNTF